MRTSHYIKLMTRLDTLEQQLKNHLLLSKQLENKWMTYATHRETGIVYDTDILDRQVMDIKEEMEQVKKELGDE
jgi:predicted phage-related endonuclease